MSMMLKVKSRLLKLRAHRLASLGPGAVVGEAGIVEPGAPRQVDAVAARGGCIALELPTALASNDSVHSAGAVALLQRRPDLQAHLLRFLLVHARTTIARMHRELSTLAQ